MELVSWNHVFVVLSFCGSCNHWASFGCHLNPFESELLKFAQTKMTHEATLLLYKAPWVHYIL